METEQKEGKGKNVNTTFSVVFTARNWKLYAVKWSGMEYCWRWMGFSV